MTPETSTRSPGRRLRTCGPDFGHRPDGLVAQPDADAGRRVVVEVQIGTADGGALDGDDDALGPGQHGIGHLLDP